MEKKKRFLVNALYYAVILCLVYLVIKYLLPILVPFIIAFLIAFLLVRPAGFLARKLKISRRPVMILLIFIFYAAVFWLILFGGSRMITVTRELIPKLPGVYNTEIVPLADMISGRLEDILSGLDAGLANLIEAGFQQMVQKFGNLISSGSLDVIKLLSGYAAGIPGMVVKLVLTVISTFFIGMDYDKVVLFFKKALPEKIRGFFDGARKHGSKMIKVYIFCRFWEPVEY